MAVVGEATILVKAITSGVAKDIQSGLSGTNVRSTAARAGKDIAGDFNKSFGKSARQGFATESMRLSKAFHKIVRSSYAVQAGVSALTGSLSALVGGLGAFAGAAGGAASAGVILGNAFAQLKVAGMVGKSAFNGISQAVQAASSSAAKGGKTIKQLQLDLKALRMEAEGAVLSEEEAAIALEKARTELARAQNLPVTNMARREAELSYKQADLAYRQATNRTKQIQEEVKKGVKGLSSAKVDPYAGLTASQKTFAKYLVSIQSKLKELRESAAGSFLPVLQAQMEFMFRSGAFDVFVKGYQQVGEALGEASMRISNSLFSPDGMRLMRDLFIGTHKTIMVLGSVIGNLAIAFMNVYRAAAPVMNIFRDFLSTKAANMAKNTANGFANISSFLKDAAKMAAMFGSVAGNVFAGLKGMIKANVGPGTGGYMLLEQLKASTQWMKQLGTAAGEFSSREYFKAVAQNTLAITNSFAGFFGILKDMGSSPDIKNFWDTLSQGQAAFAQIVNAAVGSAPILADIVVSITEMVAALTDAGQLQTYLNIINGIFKAVAGFLKFIQPAMTFIGPIIGAVGALITGLLFFSKVAKIAFGTYMTALKIASAAQVVFTAKQAGVVVAAGAVARANTGLAASYLRLGGTMTSLTPTITAFWATLTGPALPFLIILGAIATAIGVTMAINADRAKKSMTALNGTFIDARKHTLTAADANKQWAAALLTVTDNEKEAIKNMASVNAAFEAQAKRDFKPLFDSTIDPATAAFKSYGDTLAKVAKKNLPEIQGNIRNLIITQGMSKNTTLGMLNSSKDLTKSLEEQAKALGDTIYNTDGTVNAQKRLDYAIGEGAYKVALARAEREKFNKTLRAAIKTFIDTQSPLEQSAADLKKYSDVVVSASGNASFSLQKYKDDLVKQQKDLESWSKNISALSKSMSTNALKDLVAMGKGGAGLVASLVTNTNGVLSVNKKALESYEKQIAASAEAQRNAALIGSAVTDGTALKNLLVKKYGASSREVSGLGAAVAQGTLGISAAAEQAGISLDALITEQKRISATNVASKVSISGVWDKASLDTMQKEFNKALGDQTFKVVTATKNPMLKKDGGYIGRFADGSGGPVLGPGGPRSDMIPAMISNGEYVVNAAATAKNLSLLNAINSGSVAPGGVNVTVYAAPGMDEQQVGAIVASRLQSELRKASKI